MLRVNGFLFFVLSLLAIFAMTCITASILRTTRCQTPPAKGNCRQECIKDCNMMCVNASLPWRSCDQTCADGQCDMECVSKDTCDQTCEMGYCAKLVCTTGNCTQTCPFGECYMKCKASSSCKQSCNYGSCRLRCPVGDHCTQVG